MLNLLKVVHSELIFSRRVRRLVKELAQLIPRNSHVLDVGCGDGQIALDIMRIRPDVTIQGIDVLVRPNTRIKVTQFDGVNLPYKENAFDLVMFVDVLHHTENQEALLEEAQRVSRTHILLKDHCLNGFLAGTTLRLMDWVGNYHHGVSLPYDYWPERRWRAAIQKLNFKVVIWVHRLHLYPFPASLIFDRKLHFVSLLQIKNNMEN